MGEGRREGRGRGEGRREGREGRGKERGDGMKRVYYIICLQAQ